VKIVSREGLPEESLPDSVVGILTQVQSARMRERLGVIRNVNLFAASLVYSVLVSFPRFFSTFFSPYPSASSYTVAKQTCRVFVVRVVPYRDLLLPRGRWGLTSGPHNQVLDSCFYTRVSWPRNRAFHHNKPARYTESGFLGLGCAFSPKGPSLP